jgi:integrase
MRPSEAAALHWKRLPAQEERELIRKRKHVGYVDIERGGFSRVGTKTETRFVPAHPKTLKILSQVENSGMYVFIPDRNEQPDRPYTFFRRTFETSRTKTRIDGDPIRQDIDFYSFRHTARSRMAACGVQDSAAEMIIGHADKEMQRTYTHYDDEGLIAEKSKLNYPWLSILP